VNRRVCRYWTVPVVRSRTLPRSPGGPKNTKRHVNCVTALLSDAHEHLPSRSSRAAPRGIPYTKSLSLAVYRILPCVPRQPCSPGRCGAQVNGCSNPTPSRPDSLERCRTSSSRESGRRLAVPDLLCGDRHVPEIRSRLATVLQQAQTHPAVWASWPRHGRVAS
jgi:hypothetical protein